MFSAHTTPEEFKKTTITGHFGFVFCPHENEKPAFSNAASLESVFDERLLIS